MATVCEDAESRSRSVERGVPRSAPQHGWRRFSADAAHDGFFPETLLLVLGAVARGPLRSMHPEGVFEVLRAFAGLASWRAARDSAELQAILHTAVQVLPRRERGLRQRRCM